MARYFNTCCEDNHSQALKEKEITVKTIEV